MRPPAPNPPPGVPRPAARLSRTGRVRPDSLWVGLVWSRGGAFEVTLGEDITLFSKLKEMRHPDHDEVLKSLAQGLEVVEEGTG